MSRATPAQTILGTSVMMVLFALTFTTLMASVHDVTKEPIAASARAEKMKLIGEVLPQPEYDNDLLKDYVDIGMPTPLGLRDPGKVYRAMKAGKPVAALVEAVAPDGYSGDVDLLIALSVEGRVLAVRVTQQHETPGLGDYVDIHKDKDKERPWIGQFAKLGFGEVGQAQWKVKKDGGHFAYHTGATISARAVTNAVGRTLAWFESNKDKLFAAPVGGKL